LTSIDRGAVAALLARAHREVDQGLLPSCQLALAFDGELVAFEAIGDATTDTRYFVWSCTKGVMAGVMWTLIADGLDVAVPVVELVSEFGAEGGKAVVTVEHLLLHTAGFPFAPLGPPDWYDRSARLQRFGSWRLQWEPGTRFEYHLFSSFWLLAEIIERWCGATWRDVVRDRIAVPLGLPGLRIGVPVDEQQGVADVVRVGEKPPELPDVIRDDDVALFNRPEVRALGVPGAGGIMTAADLALYYQALIRRPEPVWDPGVVAEATTIRNTLPDALLGLPANRGWGVQVAGTDGSAWAHGFGRTTSSRAFGHDGAGGQIAWGDPETGLSLCYLTNGMDRDVPREWRRNIAIASLAGSCAA